MLPRVSQLQLQVLLSRQREHDARYHRDIQGLAIGPRIQHLTLHLAKYVGRLSSLRDDQRTSPLVTRTLVDGLIVSMSVCNAIELGAESIATSANEGAKLGATAGDAALSLAVPVGRLAKACEAMDHLEYLDYTREIKSAIRDVLHVLLAFWPDAQEFLVVEEVTDRWLEIENGRVA